MASLAELLRVDPDLFAAASEAGTAGSEDARGLRAWVKALPAVDKQRWLLHAIEHPEAALGAELREAFRNRRADGAAPTRRTAGELLARAEQLRGVRHTAEAAANERARAAAARARAKALDRLARRQRTAWAELEKLIEARSYGQGRGARD